MPNVTVNENPIMSDYDSPVPAGRLARLESDKVNFILIDEVFEGQRLDNFLLRIAKGVPKSHVYRVVRGGEVRVNKKRATVDTRLQNGDIVRVPPLRIAQKQDERAVPAIDQEELPVLFEDAHLLIVNKPAGLAAHGGSGVSYGLIERLRAARPEASFLELAHRLDRDTSGVLIVCKSRKALVRLHDMQREGRIQKHYRLLVEGDWVNERQHVKLPLHKYVLASGERRVRVDEEQGLRSHTIFTCLKRYGAVSYLDAELKTGRTHQIRVHAQASGHPLVGDDKYGQYDFNAAVQKGSLGMPFKRMFLHAFSLEFSHPVTQAIVRVQAPLPSVCARLLEVLEAA